MVLNATNRMIDLGRVSARALGLIVAVVVSLLSPIGCEKAPPTAPTAPTGGAAAGRPTPAPRPAGTQGIELVFPYGSEKKAWLEDVTNAFNAESHKTESGKVISVKPMAMGSGECVEEVISGRVQAHIISPASGAIIELGNARSQASTGGPLIASKQDLVLSPVVIAMWKPMAEALGWGAKPVGWSDILDLTRDPQGWAKYKYPQWGRFKFGHTHPEYSNSGLMAIIAQAYAGAGKLNGLTLQDVQSPAVANEMEQIQRGIVHYGDSTGFFGRKMFSSGPEFLSAAVLYENMVIESYQQKPATSFPVVAIYPKEGTFWSEHPVGVVERAWVTPEHRDAAKKYIEYLLANAQQKKAMQYGFRPSDVSINLEAPFDAEHGVNPKEPTTTLATPSAEVINAVIEQWRMHKKKANVVLAVDVSGSMNEDSKIGNAREGAKQLVELLSNEDTFSLMTFNESVSWALTDAKIATARPEATRVASGLLANGGTSLYDAVDAAFSHVENAPPDEKIVAIVVLSDGADRNSKMQLAQLLDHIRSDPEKRNVRVFTIGYGKDAKADVLQKIADETRAKFFKGTPENIRQVFKEIATFF
jgi:Ca-activated chloride channel family protein